MTMDEPTRAYDETATMPAWDETELGSKVNRPSLTAVRAPAIESDDAEDDAFASDEPVRVNYSSIARAGAAAANGPDVHLDDEDLKMLAQIRTHFPRAIEIDFDEE